MVRVALAANAAALLALALVLALVLRLADGSVSALVQSWYRPILVASVVVLGPCALFGGIQSASSKARWTPRFTARGATAAVLVAALILLALFFVPAPLASGNIDPGQASLPQRLANATSSNDPASRNIYQWAYEFQSASPDRLVGQPVEVIAFVYHGKDGPQDGRFMAARFVVACCVADALGVTLPVRWPAAAALPRDAWVHVKGAVARAEDGTLVVNAASVEFVNAPSNPYIYP